MACCRRPSILVQIEQECGLPLEGIGQASLHLTKIALCLRGELEAKWGQYKKGKQDRISHMGHLKC